MCVLSLRKGNEGDDRKTTRKLFSIATSPHFAAGHTTQEAERRLHTVKLRNFRRSKKDEADAQVHDKNPTRGDTQSREATERETSKRFFRVKEWILRKEIYNTKGTCQEARLKFCRSRRHGNPEEGSISTPLAQSVGDQKCIIVVELLYT